MIALLRDYLRRSWLLGVAGSAAIFAFLMIACRVFQQIQQNGGGSPLTKLVPKWVQTAFNISPSSMTDLNGFLAVMFQHPFVLTVMLGVPIALITGFLTGDVEKRTISLVLVRPISRFSVVISVMLITVFWIVLALISVWAGCAAGANWTEQTSSLNTSGIQSAVMALGLLIFAFTGISAVVSAVLSVRGDAVGWCLTIVLIMYVWNFLAQIWAGGANLPNYSLFHFYHPTDILLHGRMSLANLQALAGVGLVGWWVAGIVFRFRSFSV